jgi:hypothetical protein
MRAVPELLLFPAGVLPLVASYLPLIGVVSTMAGGGAGRRRGSRDAARVSHVKTAAVPDPLRCPAGLTMDNAGHLYVTDIDSHCIRKISAPDGSGAIQSFNSSSSSSSTSSTILSSSTSSSS